jgi:hypothetical protein
MPEASHPSEGPAGLALPLTSAERSLVTIAGRFANEMIATKRDIAIVDVSRIVGTTSY